MMTQRTLLWNGVEGWDTQLFAPVSDSELEKWGHQHFVKPKISWRDWNQMKWKTGRAVSQNLGSRWVRQTKGMKKAHRPWGELGSNTDWSRERRDSRFPFLLRTLWSAYCDQDKRIIFKIAIIYWVLCTKLSAEQYLYKMVTKTFAYLLDWMLHCGKGSH